MPIETDNSNHDFAWRFSPANESQTAVFFQLRLHKTTEYGWTISFLNDQGQPEFSLPADMFGEVGEYIRGYVNPQPAKIAPKLGTPTPKLGLPQVGRASSPPSQNRPASRTAPSPTGPRPTPVIRPDGSVDQLATKGVRAEGVEKVFAAAPVDIDEDFGEQDGTFLPPGHSIEDIEFDDDAPVFQSFTVQPPKVVAPKEVSAEEQARILAERQAAASNPAKRTGIKKRHSD